MKLKLSEIKVVFFVKTKRIQIKQISMQNKHQVILLSQSMELLVLAREQCDRAFLKLVKFLLPKQPHTERVNEDALLVGSKYANICFMPLYR